MGIGGMAGAAASSGLTGSETGITAMGTGTRMGRGILVPTSFPFGAEAETTAMSEEAREAVGTVPSAGEGTGPAAGGETCTGVTPVFVAIDVTGAERDWRSRWVSACRAAFISGCAVRAAS